MRTRITDRVKLSSGLARREISPDFKYNRLKLKPLKGVLHNINIAVGLLAASLSDFSKLKGPGISPDGLLGGLGYVMPIKEIKEHLSSSVKSLADISDTLADEITNPKWGVEDDKDVKKLIDEKEKVEEKVEDAEESAENSNVDSKGEGSKDDEEEVSGEVDDGSSSDKMEAVDDSILPDDVITTPQASERVSSVNGDPFSKAVAKNLIKLSTNGIRS